MPKDEVKLVRLPVNATCADPGCKKSLPFGTWAFYHDDSETALCVDCAVKRGWSSKDRVNELMKKLELVEDIKALRKQRKVEADALIMIREQVNLHRLGERDADLEKQIETLIATVKDYFQKCATSEEKKALEQVERALRETYDLQKEVREQVQKRLFLIERTEQKRKNKGQVVPSPFIEED